MGLPVAVDADLYHRPLRCVAGELQAASRLGAGDHGYSSRLEELMPRARTVTRMIAATMRTPMITHVLALMLPASSAAAESSSPSSCASAGSSASWVSSSPGAGESSVPCSSAGSPAADSAAVNVNSPEIGWPSADTARQVTV